MNIFYLNRTAIIALFLISFNILSLAQSGGKSVIDERNVRAGMIFLAGDALQGRGSGTIFERITAEYVGSQFMQFGAEPAGEIGYDGKPKYVQSVSVTRNSFAGNPTLKYGTGSLEHGKDLIVMRANAAAVSGGLQKINADEKPNAGAAVFIRNTVNTFPNLTQTMQDLVTGGASIVLVEETAPLRINWTNMAARRIAFTVTTMPAKPAVMIVLSKDAADALLQTADGTMIEFGGQLAPAQTQQTWNAMGKIIGSDKTLSSEVIVLSSHLDHLGVREATPGNDKIFNGADDDASGTVAVLELARVLASGKRPKRTVYFVCYGSEEAGGFGSNYFANNLGFPKEKLIANLQFEMIGRPDPMVKSEELWLTGYERSTLGPELAKRGAKLVQDPRPGQNFFQRSDNYTLARQGIIAHTVSSFGLHTDYHKVSDEIKTIDFQHMTRSINSMIEPVQWLINSSFVPVWNEGKRP